MSRNILSKIVTTTDSSSYHSWKIPRNAVINYSSTAQNTGTSPNLLVWKFRGTTHFPQSFERFDLISTTKN